MQSVAAHARYAHERVPILLALSDEPGRVWAKRVARMVDCCSTPAVGLTGAGAVGAVWFRCRDRLCPLCAMARARQTASRILMATRDADSVRFLTLTMKSSTAPLRQQLDRLYACYREFRRSVEWKRHVWGAIATLEVTRNAETGAFHPHLHILTDGQFWQQKAIADAWERVTGDSRIVDIRVIRSRRTLANYLAKYAAKPADIASWPPEGIREYADAVHRRRMVLATGNMHGSKVDADDADDDNRVQGERVPLHALERRSQLGCRRSSVVLTALVQQSAAYQNAMGKRPVGTLPVLLPPTADVHAGAARAFVELLQLWRDDPVSFVTGGSGDWDSAPRPKRPKGRGRPKDATAPIADWERPDTRHV